MTGFRIPKVIPDIVNKVTGRWAPPGTGDSKGKQRLHLDYVDRQTRERQGEEHQHDLAQRRRFRKGGRSEGLEQRMVPDMKFSSYYGRPIVKAPPWGWPIGAYLWLGGIAGGSGVLAFGGQLMRNKELTRAMRLSAFGSAALGSLALVGDLGRPERALNMFRVFKVTSPMSMGSYLLLTFATSAAFPAAAEADRTLIENGRTVALPKPIRAFLGTAAEASTPITGTLGPLLATYTGVLFADTSVPAWNEGREYLPYVFGSSGALAAGGTAMAVVSPAKAGPARVLAVAGTAAEMYGMHRMKSTMDPTVREVYEKDAPGTLLKASEVAVVAGSVGAVAAHVLNALGKKSRALSVASGVALVAGSAFTRFGVLHAGHNSVKDPKYVVEPQKRRMEKARSEGRVSENITTLS